MYLGRSVGQSGESLVGVCFVFRQGSHCGPGWPGAPGLSGPLSSWR